MIVLAIALSILALVAIVAACAILAVRVVALIAIVVMGTALVAIGYIGFAVAGLTLALSFQLLGSDWIGASFAMAILSGSLTTLGLGRALGMEFLSFLQRLRHRPR